MEVINDVIVNGNIEQRNALYAVVADAADNDVSIRRDAPDERDVFCEYAVPCVNDIFGYDFIQRLESNAVGAVLESCCDLCPESEESCLESFVVEELPLVVLSSRIERISECFVKVDQHLEAVLLAPLVAVRQMCKTSLLEIAFLVLEYHVINRYADVVETELGNLLDVFLKNICIEMILVVCAEL